LWPSRAPARLRLAASNSALAASSLAVASLIGRSIAVRRRSTSWRSGSSAAASRRLCSALRRSSLARVADPVVARPGDRLPRRLQEGLLAALELLALVAQGAALGLEAGELLADLVDHALGLAELGVALALDLDELGVLLGLARVDVVVLAGRWATRSSAELIAAFSPKNTRPSTLAVRTPLTRDSITRAG